MFVRSFVRPFGPNLSRAVNFQLSGSDSTQRAIRALKQQTERSKSIQKHQNQSRSLKYCVLLIFRSFVKLRHLVFAPLSLIRLHAKLTFSCWEKSSDLRYLQDTKLEQAWQGQAEAEGGCGAVVAPLDRVDRRCPKSCSL